jgi:hypothetical protein
VRFKTTDEGGRKTALVGEFYSCPFFVDGQAFDCRIYLDGKRIELGEWYQLPVKFLNRDLVMPMLSPYIPHFEDAIWREFPPLIWRAVRLVRDAQQGEDLCLQVGELRVEDLDSTLAAHERVPLGQTE